MKKKIIIHCAIILLCAIIFSLLVSFANADLEISSLFYLPEKRWFMGRDMPWYFLYHYGNIPAIILSAGGFLVFLLSFFQKRLTKYRKIGLFFAALMVLGPGLVVNAAFKDHWGRPRPADIVNFGGEQKYQHFWEKGKAGEGKSFPSGHASVGFYLMTPFFFLMPARKRMAWAFLGLGIIYGLFMGTGRIIQGGHFFTDVVWSGVFIYLTGYLLGHAFKFNQTNDHAGDKRI